MSHRDDYYQYNIFPLNEHREFRAVLAAIRDTSGLRCPPSSLRMTHYDLLDWLAMAFGFQSSSVDNQREHLVLHLSNAQLRLSPPPDDMDTLVPAVVHGFLHRLFKNYSSWCSYLNVNSNIRLSRSSAPSSSDNRRRPLLYISLYLLIWGESANLRFMPECICYVFHHMASELNEVLEDENTRTPFWPSVSGDNAFLNKVVKPIYDTIKAEVYHSRNGTASHSSWRNYDDMNEYFWSKRCFEKLEWPINVGSSFFVVGSNGKKVGKTGFVEQRFFWSIFRSFNRLWIMLILFLQASVIMLWEETESPWHALKHREVQVRCMSVFFTWSVLNLLDSLLEAGMHCGLVSRETMSIGVRMVLKIALAAGWVAVFWVLYGRIWSKKNVDRGWTHDVDGRVLVFQKFALAFVTTDLLGLLLLLTPFLRNHLDRIDFKLYHKVSWWFYGEGAFVSRGIGEGFVDSMKYTLFWSFVLVTKFYFSYFLQIKPMISPSKTLLSFKGIKYEWHEFFNGNNHLAVGLLWLPVVLIYFMDLQIWYSIYSSIIGSGIGLLCHLGEIRNIRQIRLRFEFLAGAIQFIMIPDIRLLGSMGTFGDKIRNEIHRLMLRYGIGRPFKKLRRNQDGEFSKVLLVWNEIINVFREEDIVSDREVELFKFPLNYSEDPVCKWTIRVIQWPCFLLSNELFLALRQAQDLLDAPDDWVWYKICKNEHRRCAVIEAYDSLRHLLLAIVKHDSEEHNIISTFFQELDISIQQKKFVTSYHLKLLHVIHERLVHLLDLILMPDKDVDKVVDALQALHEFAIRDFMKDQRTKKQVMEVGLAPETTESGAPLLFENAVELPGADDEIFYHKVLRLHTILATRNSMNEFPHNHAARRRIAFFSNSLLMNMHRAPLVEKMLAFSVLTPSHQETVLYSEEKLMTDNEDGISNLYYLQTIYPDEWRNFLERMRREGMTSEQELSRSKWRDLQLWASYRGQTLARTVRGMMYYHRTIEFLEFLDFFGEMDIREGYQTLGLMRRDNGNLSRANGSMSFYLKYHMPQGLASMKFTYVVAYEEYGSEKAQKKPEAEQILYLMKTNEALRVAYIDEVLSGSNEREYYSVLVKFDQRVAKEIEIYRIKLPGPMRVGEGKPENQNHAIIFTRGDAIQTIDANQDNYFEEALKMRNLLEEFTHYHGIRRPTILGVREHIFSGLDSSPAQFMCDQETSFVTLGQRVLANLLKVRMHYGHPDVFDRFWFLTRGGISKGSRVININEDIFAGFNCTLRKGNVTHHEYIQFGKGRDVGLNEISTFEAKIAAGSAEQAISRDVYRLGTRLDFFRMLSFFQTSVGYFFNAWMVVFAFYAYWWGRLYLAMGGVESFMMKSGKASETAALLSILSQEFLIQLGIFIALPMLVENTVEKGFLFSLWEFILAHLRLAPLFYTFSLGTRAHYFGRTLVHGRSKYRSSGRGFAVDHKSFTDNYRFYARSHFTKAVELGLLITVYSLYSPVATGAFVYLAFTMASWSLVVSWILSPFIFNPLGFDWLKTVNEFYEFKNWMWGEQRSGVFVKAGKSWEKWWYEEHDHLRTTSLWGKVVEIIWSLRFFVFQYGIVYQLDIANGSKSLAVYLLSWICMGTAAVMYVTLACARSKYDAKQHVYYRLVQFLFVILVVLVIFALLRFTEFSYLDLLVSPLVFLPSGWGLISIALVLKPWLENTWFWVNVVSAARVYEFTIGLIVLAPVAILSWLPGVQAMQNRILFNAVFSRGIPAAMLLKWKKDRGLI